jgi:glycosyltransferase 2 family protein
MKKLFYNLVKLVISAGLIVYILLYQVNLTDVWKLLTSAHIMPILLGAGIMVLGTFLRAARWGILLHALDIQVPTRKLAHLYFVGSFFNLFLPTGMGGDAVKMAKLAQETGQVPESIGTTLVERATGLWVLFILALIALPFSASFLPPTWIPYITLVTISGVVGGWVVMGTPLLPWLGSKIHLPGQQYLERLYRSVSQLGWRALAKASFVSLVFDLLLIMVGYLIAISLDIRLPMGIFFLFTPIISFSLTLPISVGGLGVREQTYILLFQAVNVSPETATAMSLLFYLLTTVFVGLIGGILYIVESLRSASIARNQIS